MKINSKSFVIYIYIFSYVFCTIIYAAQGTIEGDLRGWNIRDNRLLYLSLVQVLLSAIVYYICTSAIERSVKVRERFLLPNGTHYVFFFFFSSFAIFSIHYNYGFSSIEVDRNVPKILLQLYISSQPVFLGYIYSAYFCNETRKLFYVNVLLILSLTVYQGWLVSFIIFSVIFFHRIKSLVRNHKVYSIFTFAFIFMLIPILSFLKSIMLQINKSSDQNLSFLELYNARLAFLNINSISDFFSYYFLSVFGRFEHVSIVYYINLQGNNLYSHVRSFYQESWLSDFIYGVFGYAIDKPYVQKYVANLIEPLYAWQVQIPISARIIYLPFDEICIMLIFMIMVVYTSVFLVKLISTSSSLLALNWTALFLFLYHGWFYSVILWMQTLFVLIFILSTYRLLVRISSKEFSSINKTI
ncbi:oligosaccharide repeat unit polymerase [Aeromonas caviae]